MNYSDEEKKLIEKSFSELLTLCKGRLKDNLKAIKQIVDAYQFALEAHEGQYRKSGEPYILHPITVAKTMVQRIGLGKSSIIASLLHDVVENTSKTLPEIEHMFGSTTAYIVNGLTKLSNLKHEDDDINNLDNLKKTLLTLKTDLRIILIKLADRLHNLQTLDALENFKQQSIASETIYIYAPIAHLLGLYGIKEELECLSLKYLHPKNYFEIEEKLKSYQFEKNQFMISFAKDIEGALKSEGISAQITGRPKSIYSIYKKMKEQNISFEDIFDKFAIRVIYKSAPKDEHAMAWRIFTIITKKYAPHPQQIKNYLNFPKASGYEALHTTVIKEGIWVEVQIRSERMNETAERGYASHFKYKSRFDKQDRHNVILEKFLELFNDKDVDTSEFINQFKNNLEISEINVFTPLGEKVTLPSRSTVLDFAFKIHTELGLRAHAAKINNTFLVPLHHIPTAGDQIEIIEAKDHAVSHRWLDYAVTSNAIAHIKSALSKKEKVITSKGHEILLEKLKTVKIDFSEDVVNSATNFFSYNNKEDFYYTLGSGRLSDKSFHNFISFYKASKSKIRIFLKKTRLKRTKDKPLTSDNNIIRVKGYEEDIPYTLPFCCNPIVGDDVFGFFRDDNILEVHQTSCPDALKIKTEHLNNIVKPEWVQHPRLDFTVTLHIISTDKLGLLAKISNLFSKNQINISSLTLKSDEGSVKIDCTIQVKSNDHLKEITSLIRRLPEVRKVFRI